MSERYMTLLREYLSEPDDDVSDAMLAEVLAEGQRVYGRPAAVVGAPVPTVADLIAAEQRRARRLHPNDHAGHPDTTDIERLGILESEVQEVAVELKDGYTGTYMVWEVLQVAAVAAAWVQAWLADPEAMPASDLLAIIEGDSQ